MSNSSSSKSNQVVLKFSPPRSSPETNFFGDVLKLVSGTAFAQVLGILASPIIARLFSPEAFGVAAVFTSITGIIVTISCAQYELAILLPESHEEAANLLGASVIFVFLTTILTALGVWGGQDLVVWWLNEPLIKPYLWLIPVFNFFGGLFLAFNYWNSRTKLFGRLSISRIIRTVGQTGTQLTAGFMGFNTSGTLIGAVVFGQILSSVTLAGQIWWNDNQLFLENIRWEKIKAGIKRYKDFPLYSAWGAVLNTFSWQLPIFLLSVFFSSTVVGYYALGNRVLQVPMNFIGISLGQVFFQRASVAKNEGNLSHLVEVTFERLVKLGLFPSLIMATVGQQLFVSIFGESWAEAGVYMQILSLWTFFLFISSPLSTLFFVLERQELGLYINIALFISRLSVLVVGGASENARFTIVLFGISGILVYGFLCIWLLHISGVEIRRTLTILSYNLLIFLPLGIVFLFMNLLNVQSWIVVVAVFVASVFYFVYLLKTDRQLRRMFGHLNKKVSEE